MPSSRQYVLAILSIWWAIRQLLGSSELGVPTVLHPLPLTSFHRLHGHSPQTFPAHHLVHIHAPTTWAGVIWYLLSFRFARSIIAAHPIPCMPVPVHLDPLLSKFWTGFTRHYLAILAAQSVTSWIDRVLVLTACDL